VREELAVSPAFSGSIDLAHLCAWRKEEIKLTPAQEADRMEVRAPGISFSGSRRDCEILLADGVAVFVCGRPRFPDTDAPQSRAAAWLRLYSEHGVKAARHVRGHYCIVCIDSVRRQAVLVSDRFATWPVCYAARGPQLFVADRADQVPQPWERQIAPQALFEYFYFHMIPAPLTAYAGVERLEPASVLTFDAQGARVERHWIPRFQEYGSNSLRELTAEFRVLLRRAVAIEANHGAVGCFLSGGTDSSTVAGLLAQVTGTRARTYSIGFAERGYDEMEYARVAARHFGTDHHEHYVQPADIVAALPRLAASFDQPFGNSSTLPAYCCAQLAAGDGIAKMLGGDGGDELFGGNTRYAKQRVFDLYQTIPAGIRSRFVEPAAERRGGSRMTLIRKAASYVQQARVPMPARLESYNLLRRLGISQVLTPAFLAQVDSDAPAREQRRNYEQAEAESLVNRMLCYDWKYTLADNDLVKVRGAACLAGIAAGFPLLNDDLVDFSLRLAPEMKLRGLRLRYFFKRALKGFLPREIIVKKKHGFGLPFGPWVATDRGLQALAREALGSMAARNIVRPDFIADLLGQKLQSHPGYYGEMVWLLMALEHWLRTHSPAFCVEPSRVAA
jgi:asparagine synthase (glutamine-hydrolysing)